MKTMNGFTNELLVKKAKKNWRMRCGAFLLAVLASWYGAVPQEAGAQVTLSTNANWGAGIVLDEVQSADRDDPGSINIGAQYNVGYIVRDADLTKTIAWTTTAPLGVDLYDVFSQDVRAHRANYADPNNIVRAGTYIFQTSDAFASNGSQFTTRDDMTWSGGFNASGGTLYTQGNTLTVYGGATGAFFNNATFTINNTNAGGIGGWLALYNGSNTGVINVRTGSLSIQSDQFGSTGTINLTESGRLEIGGGVTVGGAIHGAGSSSVFNSAIWVASSGAVNANLSGSLKVIGSLYGDPSFSTPSGTTTLNNVFLDATSATGTDLTNLTIANSPLGSTEVMILNETNLGGANISLSRGYLSKSALAGTLEIENRISVSGSGGIISYPTFGRDDWDSNPDSLAYQDEARFVLSGVLTSAAHGATLEINNVPFDGSIAEGTVVLTNASNTYSGNFAIYGGTLEVSRAGQLGVHDHNYDLYTISVGNGGGLVRSAFRTVGATNSTMEVGHFFQTNGTNGFYEVYTIDANSSTTDTAVAVNDPLMADAARAKTVQQGKLFGSFDLNKAGDGTLVLASRNNQGFTGDIVIQHGTVSIDHAANLGGAKTVKVGIQRASVVDQHLFRPVFETTDSVSLDKTIEINQENSVIRTTGLNNVTTLRGEVKTGTFNGETYIAALNKEGAGKLVLAGDSTWYNNKGDLNIVQGTVQFSSDRNLTTGQITIGVNQHKDIENQNPDGTAVAYEAVLRLDDNSTASLTGNRVQLGTARNAKIDVGTASSLTVGPVGEENADSELNKIGKGELVLSGANNTYTGWTNLTEGSIRVTKENSMGNTKGVDLVNGNTTLILDANETLYGLRGYETDAEKRANPGTWTRTVQIGDNNLTLDLQNFKTDSGDEADISFFYGNIVGSGMLIKQGPTGSTFASGFDGFTGGFQLDTGGIRTLSDTTISRLNGRPGTFLDILDTTLTLDMDTDQVFDGLIYSSSTWRTGSIDKRPHILKTGVGNFTSGFYEAAADVNPERGFYGDLTLEKGNIISTTDYIMASGSTLTFHVNPDANGAVNPLTLDVRNNMADFSGGRDGEGNLLLDENQRQPIAVHVTLGESTTGWNMVSGDTVVAQILGNEESDYSALQVVETDSLFHSVVLNHVVNTDRNRGDMYVQLGVNGFGGVGEEYNEIQVGENLDRIRLQNLGNTALASLLQDMWSAGTNLDGAEMRAERVALLRNIYQQLSGDTIANGMFMGLSKPWENAFSRLNLDSQMVYIDPPQAGGARRIANMRNLWFTPTVHSLTARSDGNARRFGIDRPGYEIGFDKRVAMNTSIGFMLGYNSPKLHQGSDRITASDFQVGVYGGSMIGNYWEVKGFIGFGHQNYKSTRTIYYPDAAIIPDGHGGFRPIGGSQRTQVAHGRYDGDTFNFSLELARPLFLGFVILRPTIGLDSEHAFRYGFTETGDSIAMKFKRSSLSRTRARFAVSAETTTLDRAIFTGRLGYSCLLGGNDYATASGQFVGIAADPQSIRSVAVGKSYFEAGVGTRIFLNPVKTLSLVGQYDASVADHWAEHRAQVGITLIY